VSTAQKVLPRSLVGLRRRFQRVTEQMRVRNALAYANLAVLGERYGFPPGLAGHELKVFSQNGEDGVLAEILHRTGTTTRWFVEFGIGGGLEGNSVLLADVHAWEGLFIEGSPELHDQLHDKYEAVDRVRVTRALVTAENVESLFEAAGVPTDLDLLSIDIDGNDYWVWKAVERYRPTVVVVEYNGALDPAARLVQPYEPEQGWDGTDFYGASLGALDELGAAKGYRLVHADLTGTNAFFVREDLADRFEDCYPVTPRRASIGLTDFRHVPDPHGRSYLVPEP
jgi:hypothetical protein